GYGPPPSRPPALSQGFERLRARPFSRNHRLPVGPCVGASARRRRRLLLTVEELAVNDLRDMFHHWIRGIAVPMRKRSLGEVWPPRPAGLLRAATSPPTASEIAQARDVWDEIASDARDL